MNDGNSAIALAPWTPEQIKALEYYQNVRYVHPYTCGNSSLHDNLIPTASGWICPNCEYKQNWAHESSTDLEYLKLMNGSLPF